MVSPSLPRKNSLCSRRHTPLFRKSTNDSGKCDSCAFFLRALSYMYGCSKLFSLVPRDQNKRDEHQISRQSQQVTHCLSDDRKPSTANTLCRAKQSFQTPKSIRTKFKLTRSLGILQKMFETDHACSSFLVQLKKRKQYSKLEKEKMCLKQHKQTLRLGDDEKKLTPIPFNLLSKKIPQEDYSSKKSSEKSLFNSPWEEKPEQRSFPQIQNTSQRNGSVDNLFTEETAF